MKKLFLSLLLALVALPSLASDFVTQLMQKMTLEEKIGQLNLQVAGDITTGGAQNTQVGSLIAAGQLGGVFNIKGVDQIRALQQIAVKQSRLGIPLIVGMDVIHGYETIFPIPLAMACSWDMAAIEQAAHIAGKEASADGICWVYSPMVDIALDPRWGRMAEGAGEDPFLGSAIAKAYVRGYQGTSYDSPDRVMACLKHFALYGAVEAGRDYNTVDMSHVRMYNQYFPPYRAAVEAGVGSIMSSFNLVDGEHATASHWLLTDVLRKQWQFPGFVVTDYGSIGEMTNHGFGDLKTNSARALKAGTDMDMCAQGYLKTLAQSVKDGTVSEADIDVACRRVLEAKYHLGLFKDPYRFLDKRRRNIDIYTRENRQAARDLAAETFVLLKNQDNLLPLRKQGKIALIGPLANDRKNVAGTWCVAYTPERYATVKEGLERAVYGKAEVLYAQGCNLTDDEALQRAAEFGKELPRGDARQLHDEAIDVARQADVIVCCMGECADMSGESSSRADLRLPDAQRRLLEELVTLGKPVVLLNFSGRSTILTWEQQHVDAILNVWFGGSEAGDAIADVLFGDKCPSGKLVTTFPQAIGQIPLYYNHLNTGRPVPEGADRYYKYASNYLDVRNDPLYPFGYGLSYTTFSYGKPVLSQPSVSRARLLAANVKGQAAQLADSVVVTVSVTNSGQRDADEIAQCYVHQRAAAIARPVKELKGFRRIHLKAGETQQVSFTLRADAFSYYDAQGNAVLEPGTFDIMTGPNSRDVQPVTLTVK